MKTTQPKRNSKDTTNQGKRSSKELKKLPIPLEPETIGRVPDQKRAEGNTEDTTTETRDTREINKNMQAELKGSAVSLTIQIEDQHEIQLSPRSTLPRAQIKHQTQQKNGLDDFKQVTSRKYNDSKYRIPAITPSSTAQAENKSAPTSPKPSVSYDQGLPKSILEAMHKLHETSSPETLSESVASSHASQTVPPLPSSPRGSLSKIQQKGSGHSPKSPRSSISSPNKSESLPKTPTTDTDSTHEAPAISARGSLSKVNSQGDLKSPRGSASSPSYGSTTKRPSKSNPQKPQEKEKALEGEAANLSTPKILETTVVEQDKAHLSKTPHQEMGNFESSSSNILRIEESIRTVNDLSAIEALQQQLTAHKEQVMMNELLSRLETLRLQLEKKHQDEQVKITFLSSEIAIEQHKSITDEVQFINTIIKSLKENFKKFFITELQNLIDNVTKNLSSGDTAQRETLLQKIKYSQNIKTLIEKGEITIDTKEKDEFIKEFKELYQDMIDECKKDYTISIIYPDFGCLEPKTDPNKGSHSWSIFMNDEGRKEGAIFALFDIEDHGSEDSVSDNQHKNPASEDLSAHQLCEQTEQQGKDLKRASSDSSVFSLDSEMSDQVLPSSPSTDIFVGTVPSSPEAVSSPNQQFAFSNQGDSDVQVTGSGMHANDNPGFDNYYPI